MGACSCSADKDKKGEEGEEHNETHPLETITSVNLLTMSKANLKPDFGKPNIILDKDELVILIKMVQSVVKIYLKETKIKKLFLKISEEGGNLADNKKIEQLIRDKEIYLNYFGKDMLKDDKGKKLGVDQVIKKIFEYYLDKYDEDQDGKFNYEEFKRFYIDFDAKLFLAKKKYKEGAMGEIAYKFQYLVKSFFVGHSSDEISKEIEDQMSQVDYKFDSDYGHVLEVVPWFTNGDTDDADYLTLYLKLCVIYVSAFDVNEETELVQNFFYQRSKDVYVIIKQLINISNKLAEVYKGV